MEQPAKTVVRLSRAPLPNAVADGGPETHPGTPLGTPLGPGAAAADAFARSPRRIAAPARLRSPFLPLTIVCTALWLWLAFQAWQLLNERQALQAVHASQQQGLEGASKLRTSLDALAADTQKLADAGNASARLLVEELKKRGVTINPAAAATGSPKP
jgi:hypothetical protein